MLKPIPAKMLHHSVVFRIVAGTDVWQNPQVQEVTASKVCMQPSSETRRTAQNTEVVLRSMLFVDARLSRPIGIDPAALKVQSEQNGAPLTCTFNGQSYTVHTVETLYDDEGRLHHYEVGLV